MTIALELVGTGHLTVVRADAIPLQAALPEAAPQFPAVIVSLTQGCDAPLDALKSTGAGAVSCHPCDEAIVRLLLGRVPRHDGDLIVTVSIRPGTLHLGSWES